MQFTFAKNHGILSTHSNATSKNVSWPHFSWPTLYIQKYQNLKGVTWVRSRPFETTYIYRLLRFKASTCHIWIVFKGV